MAVNGSTYFESFSVAACSLVMTFKSFVAGCVGWLSYKKATFLFLVKVINCKHAVATCCSRGVAVCPICYRLSQVAVCHSCYIVKPSGCRGVAVRRTCYIVKPSGCRGVAVRHSCYIVKPSGCRGVAVRHSCYMVKPSGCRGVAVRHSCYR